jgi:hypothetical protein
MQENGCCTNTCLPNPADPDYSSWDRFCTVIRNRPPALSNACLSTTGFLNGPSGLIQICLLLLCWIRLRITSPRPAELTSVSATVQSYRKTLSTNCWWCPICHLTQWSLYTFPFFDRTSLCLKNIFPFLLLKLREWSIVSSYNPPSQQQLCQLDFKCVFQLYIQTVLCSSQSQNPRQNKALWFLCIIASLISAEYV